MDKMNWLHAQQDPQGPPSWIRVHQPAMDIAVATKREPHIGRISEKTQNNDRKATELKRKGPKKEQSWWT